MDSHGRQQLLELVYDLLPADEAAELRERIRTDPAWAAAYAEAQDTARFLAEAARLPAEAVRCRTLASRSAPAHRPLRPAASRCLNPPKVAFRPAKEGPLSLQRKAAVGRRPLARAATWARGAGRRALGAVLGRRIPAAPRATCGDHGRTAPSVRRRAIGDSAPGPMPDSPSPPRAWAGGPCRRRSRSALSAADKRLKTYRETADEQGRLQVAVPADLNFPDRARLEVVAWYGKSKAAAETSLPVEPAQRWVVWRLDRPQYRPGETLRFRFLVLSAIRGAGRIGRCRSGSRFSTRPERSSRGCSSELVAARGQGAGEFVIPPRVARRAILAGGREPRRRVSRSIPHIPACRRRGRSVPGRPGVHCATATGRAKRWLPTSRPGGRAAAPSPTPPCTLPPRSMVNRCFETMSAPAVRHVPYRVPPSRHDRSAATGNSAWRSWTGAAGNPSPSRSRSTCERSMLPSTPRAANWWRDWKTASTSPPRPGWASRCGFPAGCWPAAPAKVKTSGDEQRAVRTIETIHEGHGRVQFRSPPRRNLPAEDHRTRRHDDRREVARGRAGRRGRVEHRHGLFAAGQPLQATILAASPRTALAADGRVPGSASRASRR